MVVLAVAFLGAGAAFLTAGADFLAAGALLGERCAAVFGVLFLADAVALLGAEGFFGADVAAFFAAVTMISFNVCAASGPRSSARGGPGAFPTSDGRVTIPCRAHCGNPESDPVPGP